MATTNVETIALDEIGDTKSVLEAIIAITVNSLNITHKGKTVRADAVIHRRENNELFYDFNSKYLPEHITSVEGKLDGRGIPESVKVSYSRLNLKGVKAQWNALGYRTEKVRGQKILHIFDSDNTCITTYSSICEMGEHKHTLVVHAVQRFAGICPFTTRIL